jgi:septum site-determining protein MinC
MELKGDKRGLRLIAKGFPDEAALLEDLERTLARQRGFLGQAPLELEVADRPLTPSLLAGAAQVFERFPELDLVGVGRSGARTRPAAVPPAPRGPLLVRTPLRSGQVIEHAGDVVILGDVNPGSRVVTGGDLFVLGRLRGQALVGQPDREDAVIYALAFEPSQVRIATVWAVPAAAEMGREPERAHLESGSIVVTPWRGAPEGMRAVTAP